MVRALAHKVLTRVECDQAFAHRVLEVSLRRGELPPRDRALATELVYGVLRQQGYLDFLLRQLAKRGLRKLRPEVLVALRLGAYQIVSMRVPAYAAVDASVALVKACHRHQAGFANAVLRRLAALASQGALPRVLDGCADPVVAMATEGSHPIWLVSQLLERLGPEEVRAWMAENNRVPPLCLRVNPLRTDRETLAARLGSQAELELPVDMPQGLLLRCGGDVQALAGFAQGHFSVQDLAAQLVGHLADPQPRTTILDACAAPGGKSTHVAELTGDNARVIAVDRHPGKLDLVRQSAERLGLESIRTVSADAAALETLKAALGASGTTEVDLALLDAPCTGTGTLRRHPELRYRLSGDLAALCQAQDQLLDAVAGVVARGGRLIFSVCSITEEESVARLAGFLSRHPDYEVTEALPEQVKPFLEEIEMAGRPVMVLRTWPHRHNMDGFFAVSLTRNG